MGAWGKMMGAGIGAGLAVIGAGIGIGSHRRARRKAWLVSRSVAVTIQTCGAYFRGARRRRRAVRGRRLAS